jgi:predicted GIY-YIG superfamily endonuclease
MHRGKTTHRNGVDAMGTVYLIHFDRPYHHARHYIGYTDDVDARLAGHLSA